VVAALEPVIATLDFIATTKAFALLSWQLDHLATLVMTNVLSTQIVVDLLEAPSVLLSPAPVNLVPLLIPSPLPVAEEDYFAMAKLTLAREVK